MNYELDLVKLIRFRENNVRDDPKLSIPFSINTTYLNQEFALDVVVWNLTAENLKQTKKVIQYILMNFSKLFETAWTALYYYYMEQAQCSLAEFYQKIDFDYPYYSIRIELNSNYLEDSIARYHFVVATENDLSEDNIRLYMRDNKCWACDTNNEGLAILAGANFEDLYTPQLAEEMKESFEKSYEKMEKEQFQFAKSFCE